MDNRDFFNKLAFKWDNINKHNKDKLNKILSISNIEENSVILDVGTGTGVLIEYLLSCKPKKIIAIDIAENMIKMAKEKYSDDRVKFIVDDVMNYNEKGFDCIFLYSVYPHFKDKERLFSHLYKRLNIGGKIIIAHSESKEKINKIHSERKEVKEDKLPKVEFTAEIMKNYFHIDKMIDNDDMYYISGIKL